MMNKVVYV